MNSPWISLITAKPFLLACCFSLTIKIYHNSSSWQLKSCLLVFLLRVYSFVVLSMFIFGIETEPCWNYSLFILVVCNGRLMCLIGSHPSLQVKPRMNTLVSHAWKEESLVKSWAQALWCLVNMILYFLKATEQLAGSPTTTSPPQSPHQNTCCSTPLDSGYAGLTNSSSPFEPQM